MNAVGQQQQPSQRVRLFDEISERLTTLKHHTSSTAHSRQTMRATMGIQLSMSMVVKYSYFALLPFILSQAALSTTSSFSLHIKTVERVCHRIQATLSWIQFILIITMYFSNQDCASQSCNSKQDVCTIYSDAQFLCKLYMFFEMINQGVVLIGFIPGELNKDCSGSDTSSSQSSHTQSRASSPKLMHLDSRLFSISHSRLQTLNQPEELVSINSQHALDIDIENQEEKKAGSPYEI